MFSCGYVDPGWILIIFKDVCFFYSLNYIKSVSEVFDVMHVPQKILAVINWATAIIAPLTQAGWLYFKNHSGVCHSSTWCIVGLK